MAENKRYPVKMFDPFLICVLCKGYLNEAMTIGECMHSCKLIKLKIL